MDTQTIEILGRNRLINDLLEGGLEVAQPIRDRGIDVIAYLDLNAETKEFIAIPIQMKASSTSAFAVYKKYSRISNLILAFVWGLREPSRSQIFALSYAGALDVAEKMGWTSTPSWRKGGYSTSAPSKKLLQLLNQYRMSPRHWRKRLTEVHK